MPAGAFAQGTARLSCVTDFERSTLVALLRRSTRRDEEQARSTSWYASLTRFYIVAVLLLAGGAFGGWAQSLGMVFSLMLWAPSWGGMLNGLLTLRGAWSKLREGPVLKFLAAGVTFYGMATFEGPLLSIKSVSGLAHYTDWIIGHVHAGTLGWNGFMAAGMFYFLVPRFSGRPLWSKRLADLHFWIGTFGILLYVVSMWVSGITQGMMWRATSPDGSLLYPTFVETLIAIRPMYWTRLVGGSMYFAGMVMMGYNLVRTGLTERALEVTVDVVPLARAPEIPWRDLVFSTPILVVAGVIGLAGVGFASNAFASPFFFLMALFVALAGLLAAARAKRDGGSAWHRVLEGRALILAALAAIAVLAGGVAELVPTLFVHHIEADTRPYRALELEGRDAFMAEGCYNCHSQMHLRDVAIDRPAGRTRAAHHEHVQRLHRGANHELRSWVAMTLDETIFDVDEQDPHPRRR